MDDKWNLSDQEWKRRLPKEVYEVCRLKGTEKPFSGQYNDFYEKGVYLCTLCSQPLFLSDSKYASHSGWPSFFQPFDEKAIHFSKDLSHHMERVEITCSRCGSHLGHVFEDGPLPTKKRFCVNSLSLTFHPEKS